MLLAVSAGERTDGSGCLRNWGGPGSETHCVRPKIFTPYIVDEVEATFNRIGSSNEIWRTVHLRETKCLVFIMGCLFLQLLSPLSAMRHGQLALDYLYHACMEHTDDIWGFVTSFMRGADVRFWGAPYSCSLLRHLSRHLCDCETKPW